MPGHGKIATDAATTNGSEHRTAAEPSSANKPFCRVGSHGSTDNGESRPAKSTAVSAAAQQQQAEVPALLTRNEMFFFNLFPTALSAAADLSLIYGGTQFTPWAARNAGFYLTGASSASQLFAMGSSWGQLRGRQKKGAPVHKTSTDVAEVATYGSALRAVERQLRSLGDDAKAMPFAMFEQFATLFALKNGVKGRTELTTKEKVAAGTVLTGWLGLAGAVLLKSQQDGVAKLGNIAFGTSVAVTMLANICNRNRSTGLTISGTLAFVAGAVNFVQEEAVATQNHELSEQVSSRGVQALVGLTRAVASQCTNMSMLQLALDAQQGPAEQAAVGSDAPTLPGSPAEPDKARSRSPSRR